MRLHKLKLTSTEEILNKANKIEYPIDETDNRAFSWWLLVWLDLVEARFTWRF